MKRTAWPPLLIGGLCLVVSGCITEPSTEVTTAPTDATSDLTNGTSNAIGDIVGATSDFTSSTTPGATYGNDALARARKKTELFTMRGYENIRSDVARGSGEYLWSLGTLAGGLQIQNRPLLQGRPIHHLVQPLPFPRNPYHRRRNRRHHQRRRYHKLLHINMKLQQSNDRTGLL